MTHRSQGHQGHSLSSSDGWLQYLSERREDCQRTLDEYQSQGREWDRSNLSELRRRLRDWDRDLSLYGS